jgi:hypothetical protein
VSSPGRTATAFGTRVADIKIINTGNRNVLALVLFGGIRYKHKAVFTQIISLKVARTSQMLKEKSKP